MKQLTDSSPPSRTPHERSGPPVLGNVSSFPSFAELARTLAERGALASLATLTSDGFPYTSMAPMSVDPDGAPIICISELAEHTRNLRRSGRASVLVTAPNTEGVDPLSKARSTYVGTFSEFEPDQATIARHLDAHPSTHTYVGFGDFGWWRMDVQQLRYVGGFGVMGWASPEDLADSSADPVIPVAAPMIEHLNDDHADAIGLLAGHAIGTQDALDATVTDLDRYGLTLLARGPSGTDRHAIVRVAFPTAIQHPDQVRAAVVDLVRSARGEDTMSPTSSEQS